MKLNPLEQKLVNIALDILNQLRDSGLYGNLNHTELCVLATIIANQELNGEIVNLETRQTTQLDPDAKIDLFPTTEQSFAGWN